MTDALRIDIPQPGYYQRRLVRGGPWVACRIWRDDSIPERPAVLMAECGGKEADPYQLWPSCCGHPISEAEYHYLSSVKAWADQYAPAAPEANPTHKIDLSKQPAIGPRSAS